MKSSLQYLYVICVQYVNISSQKQLFKWFDAKFWTIPLATISFFPPKGQDYGVIIVFEYQFIEINSSKQLKAFIPIV
jgi:hypothetical protein